MENLTIDTQGILGFESIIISEPRKTKKGWETTVIDTENDLALTMLDDLQCVSFIDEQGNVKRVCPSQDYFGIFVILNYLLGKNIDVDEKSVN